LLLSFCLVLPVIAVYYPIHTHPFCGLDDYLYVVNNTAIHHGLNWATVRWSFMTFGMGNWIPVSWLSHALDYQLFGLNPAGHHMVNVLLHALNVVLLFWVLKRATNYTGRSFMVAALFALHPMNVEPVAWVAELKTMLSMLFFLLALDAYRRYAHAPQIGRYMVVVVLFGAGLLAKPQIVTLPFVLLLWDYWPLQRMFPINGKGQSASASLLYPGRSFYWLAKEKIPLLFVAGADALATMKAQSGWKFKPPLSLRLENAVFSYWLYIKKAFWPSGMAAEYPHLGRFLTPRQVLAAVIFLLVITVLVMAARRYRYLPVGWFWFLGTLVPTIGLDQVGLQGMADRYAYESFLGLFLMVCWGVSDWALRRVSVKWLAAASAVVLLALTLVTSRQIGYWQDEFTLWNHAAEVVPNNELAEANVGAILMGQGKKDEAMAHFFRAANISPTDSFVNMQVALYEQERGNLREAITYYQHALQDYDYNLTPETKLTAWVNMGIAYRDLGDATNAHLCFHKAAEVERQAKELQKLVY
jgi:tetratricopeptide (TPR) repeat protein